MKWALLAVVLALAFAFSWPEPGSANPLTVAMLDSNVFIVGDGYTCSGTLVRDDAVLTAHHCLGSLKPDVDASVVPNLALPLGLSVYAAGGQVEAVVSIMADSVGYDVAVVKLAGPMAPPAIVARFDSAPMEAGDEVWLTGNPLQEGWVAFWGHVAKVSHEDQGEGCDAKNKVGATLHWDLLLDLRGYPGDSGGGVWDSRGILRGLYFGANVEANCSMTPEQIEAAPATWGLAVAPQSVAEVLRQAGVL